MKTTTFLKTMLAAAILSLGSISVNAAYEGTGVFEKITSMEDLTDGYYVITGNGYNNAMTASVTGSAGSAYLNVTEITPVADKISNPATNIVWEIKLEGGKYTIQNGDNYVRYRYPTGTANNNAADFSIELNDSTRWTVSYNETEFIFTNARATDRMLQYYFTSATSPRFACYTTNREKLSLYKLTEQSCTDAGLTFGFSEQVNKKTGDSKFTITAITTIIAAISYSSNNEAVASVDASTGEVTVGHAGVAKITATIEEDGEFCAGAADYTIEVLPGGETKTYKLVTSAADLVDNGKYLIVGKKTGEPDVYYALGWQKSANRNAVIVDVTDNTIEVEPASELYTEQDNYYPYEITLKESGEEWNLLDALNGEYLRCASGASSNLVLDTEAITYKIDIIDENAADIICTGMAGSTLDTIRFNAGAGSLLFSSYGKTQSPVYLYKYDDGGNVSVNSVSVPSINVYGNTGEIIIQATAGEKITVYNTTGQVITNTTTTADITTIPAAAGVYIVRAGNTVMKVIVP